MNLDEALGTFIDESRELLAEMETSLLQLGQDPQTSTHINAIFRAAHTIKGSAGLFGLDEVVAFTHVAETLLDQVREGQVLLDEPLVTLLLGCCDHMQALVDAVENRSDLQAPALVAQGKALVDLLQARSQAAQGGAAARDGAQPVAADAAESAASADSAWHIAVRFGATVLQNGMDPLSFLRYLQTMGEVLHIELLCDAVPTLDALQAEDCYLGFVVHLRTAVAVAELESVFEFVRDDCTLCITPLAAASISAATCGAVDDTCTSAGACSPWQCSPQGTCAALPDALPASSDLPTATVPAPTPAPAQACPVQPQVAASLTESMAAVGVGGARHRSSEQSSVRVDAHKLDQLINLVGELIIASAGANEVARTLRNTDMMEANATLTALVEQVRDQALQLRMVKIGGTFSKFQRVVHDVARELGKDIVLQVSGEDTELDKTVVERIGDPLTHLVRNAMDHGIEPAEVRLARGKPAQGTVRLNAYHESGSIVMEISDDGGGLDRERILAKGIERGLVEPGRALSDKEIYALIFEPGFSTAEHITNLSGRGVGMDVVKSNITALRGTVELDSIPGVGTRVQVRLPLTLAIINGFQVRVGHAVFVIPLDMVDECIEYTGNLQQRYTDLRGSVLPFVALREHFGIQGAPSARPNIVVLQHGNARFGLLVDELLGEAQTVIKPLSRIFRQAQGISGSSILGNGNVALILDIPVLHQQMLQRSAMRFDEGHAPASTLSGI